MYSKNVYNSNFRLKPNDDLRLVLTRTFSILRKILFLFINDRTIEINDVRDTQTRCKKCALKRKIENILPKIQFIPY